MEESIDNQNGTVTIHGFPLDVSLVSAKQIEEAVGDYLAKSTDELAESVKRNYPVRSPFIDHNRVVRFGTWILQQRSGFPVLAKAIHIDDNERINLLISLALTPLGWVVLGIGPERVWAARQR